MIASLPASEGGGVPVDAGTPNATPQAVGRPPRAAPSGCVERPELDATTAKVLETMTVRHNRPGPRHARRAPSRLAEALERRLLFHTFVVTNTLDAGPGSLRQAVLHANANPDSANLNDPAIDRVEFSIPGAGPHVIQVATPLPAITGRVALDATTQPGYAGSPLIELRGPGTAVALSRGFDLKFDSLFSVVQGFAVHGFTVG